MQAVELQEEETGRVLTSSFLIGRVKKKVKLDREIKKVNSETLFLISLSTDLFLASLNEGARDIAIHKKQRITKLDHLRSAVRGHPPNSDFLLDCLPNPSQPPTAAAAVRTISVAPDKPLPPGTRRIDKFFLKPSEVPQ